MPVVEAGFSARMVLKAACQICIALMCRIEETLTVSILMAVDMPKRARVRHRLTPSLLWIKLILLTSVGEVARPCVLPTRAVLARAGPGLHSKRRADDCSTMYY